MTCLFAARGNCDGPANHRVVRRSADGRLLGTDEPCCWPHAFEEVDRLATTDGRAYFTPLDVLAGAPRVGGVEGSVRVS